MKVVRISVFYFRRLIFRRSRVKNGLADAIEVRGDRLVCKVSDEEYAALENLQERLDDLIGYMHGWYCYA